MQNVTEKTSCVCVFFLFVGLILRLTKRLGSKDVYILVAEYFVTNLVSVPLFRISLLCSETTYFYSSRVSFIFHISVYILFRSIIFFLNFYFLWNPYMHA